MEKRARSILTLAAVPLVAALALGACAAASAPGWTYVPPAATQQTGGAGASGAPAASSAAGSPAMSGMPMAGGASSPAPAASGGTGGSGAGTANEIDLVETAALQITDPNGQQVTNITVKQGQTYHFKITNTAGFTHNFYVGKVSDLEAGNTANATGTGDFSSGTKEFDYTFSDTSAPMGFGCLVPGHYQAGMKGTFTIQP